jgi:hypothetical protein
VPTPVTPVRTGGDDADHLGAVRRPGQSAEGPVPGSTASSSGIAAASVRTAGSSTPVSWAHQTIVPLEVSGLVPASAIRAWARVDPLPGRAVVVVKAVPIDYAAAASVSRVRTQAARTVLLRPWQN